MRKLASSKLGPTAIPTFAGAVIGTLTLADGSIIDSGGAIDFGDEDLSTSGTLTLSGLTAGRIPFAGTGGLISDDASLLWDNSTKKFGIRSTDASNLIQLYHDNESAHFTTTDGSFIFHTDEGTNTNTVIEVRGKGTGIAEIRCYDEDELQYLKLNCLGGASRISAAGAAATRVLDFQVDADSTIRCFSGATSGETREFKIYGFRTGDSSRSLEIGVGVDADDTASFDGLSNYLFDGALRCTKLGIGIVASDGTLHVHTGSAGSVTANASADDLVIEGSTYAGMSILTPNNISGYIYFGDADSNFRGGFEYEHTLDKMHFYAGASAIFNISSNGITTEKTINASAGEVLVEDNATSEPADKSDGYVGVAQVSGEGRIYFNVEGVRYYCEATGADISPTIGNPIGLLLALTYAA